MTVKKTTISKEVLYSESCIDGYWKVEIEVDGLSFGRRGDHRIDVLREVITDLNETAKTISERIDLLTKKLEWVEKKSREGQSE